jgi:hypothetical protein
MKIQMITELAEGIYRSDRDAWAVPEEMDATRANLAYMLDWAEYRRIDTRGCFGNIGRGETIITLITDDGTKIEITEDNENEIYDMISNEGSLHRAQLSEITGNVWNGNNHQFFIPLRSEHYCSEPDIKTYPWGTITYRVVDEWRMIDSDTVNPDWVMLAWNDNGGYNDGVLSREQFEQIQENPDPFDKLIEKFTDEQSETVALFCKKSDLEQVKQILAAMEAED